MAGNVLKYFCPATSQLASSNPHLSQLLDFFFPDPPHIPTLHLKVFGSKPVDVKWPLVAACALAGILVLSDAGKRLFRLSRTKHEFKGSFSWSMAMWWYALMCVGGFWFHSIHQEQLFYNLDVVGTACSSVSIIAGSVGIDDRNPSNRRILLAVYLSATVGGLFSGSQLMRELLYLLPAASAFVCAFVFYVKTVAIEFGGGRKRGEEKREKRRRKEKVGRWLLVAGLGGASTLVGLVFSRWIVVILGQNFSLAFWCFFGSEVALWALFRLVVALNDVDFQVFA